MTNAELEARVLALEAAVERLNAQATGVVAGRAAPVDADRLWALEGVEARAPEGAVLYVGSVRTPTGDIVRWQYGQTGPDLFAEDWAEQADRLAALGSPVRLRIMQAALRGVTSAVALAEEVDAGTSGQVYHHLKELTATGWLVSPKRGVFLVPGSRVVPLLTVLLAAGTPSG